MGAMLFAPLHKAGTFVTAKCPVVTGEHDVILASTVSLPVILGNPFIADRKTNAMHIHEASE
jgi:hypothetical protein